MTKYTAIYARVSTDEQVDGYSIDSQLRLGLEKAKQLNLDNTRKYIDDGFSARNVKRPAIRNLILDIKNGLINNLIIVDIDRLSRNVADLSHLMTLLIDNNVELITCYGDSKMKTADDRLIIRFKGSIAQHTSEKTSEHTLRGLKEGLEKGDYVFATAPYGYFKDPENRKQLLPFKKELAIVKTIFDWYCLEDLSTTAISKKFKEEKNLEIKINKISSILKNEKYTGSFTYQNKIFSGYGLLPLVTTEQFEYVKNKMKLNYNCRKHDYFFAKKFICSECGEILTCTSTSKKNKTYLYYACLNKNCLCYNKRISQNQALKIYEKTIIKLYNKNKYTFFNKKNGGADYKIKVITQLSIEEIKEVIIRFFKERIIHLK